MATEIQVKAKRNIFKSDGWKRFSKNKLALIGLIIITLLIPMAAISTGGMWFPVVFAVATALPVAVVAWLLAYSIAGIGRFYNRLQVFERWMRRIVGWLFTGTGLYYLIRLL